MPDSFTSRLYAETRTINASAETVYAALTDFAAYPQWNPWIVAVQGEPSEGSAVIATNNEGKVYYHRILDAERPKRFRWCDVGWFTRFAYGERARSIEPIDDTHCHYRCELSISGPLCLLAHWLYGRGIQTGMQTEADALQLRCQQSS
ncbi:MAG TPA: SRPBCC domain-containing protein [Pseudomonadales bacterium]|nr:SRPBCC domain-containing protein [Pseudomonadales bacterium]